MEISMATKDVLEDFSRQEDPQNLKMQEDEASIRREIEHRIRNINQCFETFILPSVRSVKNDLKETGYAHQVTIG
jgi:hypothetical protein